MGATSRSLVDVLLNAQRKKQNGVLINRLYSDHVWCCPLVAVMLLCAAQMALSVPDELCLSFHGTGFDPTLLTFISRQCLSTLIAR